MADSKFKRKNRLREKGINSLIMPYVKFDKKFNIKNQIQKL